MCHCKFLVFLGNFPRVTLFSTNENFYYLSLHLQLFQSLELHSVARFTRETRFIRSISLQSSLNESLSLSAKPLSLGGGIYKERSTRCVKLTGAGAPCAWSIRVYIRGVYTHTMKCLSLFRLHIHALTQCAWLTMIVLSLERDTVIKIQCNTIQLECKLIPRILLHCNCTPSPPLTRYVLPPRSANVSQFTQPHCILICT